MPRPTRDTWIEIRAERETGASFGELATKYGISKAAIIKRAHKEGWGDGGDVAEEIRRRVNEKLAGTVVPEEKREAAMDAAAELAAEVVMRHQEETNAARERLYAGLKAHKAATTKEEKSLAFEDLKAAKIAAEALAIIQRLERINWGLDDTRPKMEIVIERSYGVTQ
jgi:DNA-binding MurR/RpiR family transcriptional regulator